MDSPFDYFDSPFDYLDSQPTLGSNFVDLSSFSCMDNRHNTHKKKLVVLDYDSVQVLLVECIEGKRLIRR